MILAKFGQKLLAVENSAGIALGCIEADFLRFESSGIARRGAQPLPQHHWGRGHWRRRLVQLLLLYLSLRWTVWRSTVGDMTADRENFRKRLLVFGCVVADLCKPIRALQHFQKCTRLSN